MKLSEMYKAAAQIAINEGVEIDDTPNGAVSQWVDRNVRHNPEMKFFIVFGIACEMANIKAQSEGYNGAVDKAFTLALAKHPDAFKKLAYS